MIELLTRPPENLNNPPSVVMSNDYMDIQYAVGGGNFDVMRTKWRGEEVDLFFYDDIGVEKELPNEYVRALFDFPIRGVVLMGGGVDDKGNTKPIGPLMTSHLMRFIHHRNNR